MSLRSNHFLRTLLEMLPHVLLSWIGWITLNRLFHYYLSNAGDISGDISGIELVKTLNSLLFYCCIILTVTLVLPILIGAWKKESFRKAYQSTYSGQSGT